MKQGFTLVELAVVLVIIGLIVGGVLVGQDLIGAARITQQLRQIRLFDQAATTFRTKYGYLPGDISANAASQFGFKARGTYGGQGDGNGILAGTSFTAAAGCGYKQSGENIAFWVDLSTAGLIPSQLTVASPTAVSATDVTTTTSPGIADYFPAATIGNGNNVYVFSGGNGTSCSLGNFGDGKSYYGISVVTMLGPVASCGADCMQSSAGLSVLQAENIDTKMDDGFPQTGIIQAYYIVNNPPSWSTYAPASTTNTCFETNTGSYSVKINNGANKNCGLSILMQ